MNDIKNIKLNEKDISKLSINLINSKQYHKAEFILLNSIKKITNSHFLFNHLGYLYFETGQLEKCIKYYELSLKIEKKNREAYCNLGTAYLFKNEYILSKKIFEQGLKILPNNENILIAYSQLLFATKDTKEAFRTFESRKRTQGYRMLLDNLKMDEWKGQDLNGKSILIISEQGIGDIIQFSRYIFELKKRFDVKIIFKVRKKLHHLFKNFEIKLIGPEDPLLDTDYYQCLMTLPAIFYELENKLISNYNFINCENKLSNYWNKKLNHITGYKIGLCWQGDPNYGRDFMRSIPLKKFEKLFLIPNLNFINFTKGAGQEQLKDFKFKEKIYDFSNELDNGNNSFEDSIALLKNIDLLITADTAVGHVASTMDIKTWLLLDYSADWRWHAQMNNFCWYNNLKFFRQKKFNVWDDIIDDIAIKLENLKL
ncbi:hypothetical protein N9U19_00445 [Candidatus Pelagibacter sp.]|nr:hypothetical protein [Candidatus Pelagibacter sp.]